MHNIWYVSKVELFVFQSDMDVDMLQDEIVSCSGDCFIMGSLTLNSFNGLCFKWVWVVELGFNGLHFEWVSLVELGLSLCFEWVSVVELSYNGLCFVWVLVVYVLMDYSMHFKLKCGQA